MLTSCAVFSGALVEGERDQESGTSTVFHQFQISQCFSQWSSGAITPTGVLWYETIVVAGCQVLLLISSTFFHSGAVHSNLLVKVMEESFGEEQLNMLWE